MGGNNHQAPEENWSKSRRGAHGRNAAQRPEGISKISLRGGTFFAPIHLASQAQKEKRAKGAASDSIDIQYRGGLSAIDNLVMKRERIFVLASYNTLSSGGFGVSVAGNRIWYRWQLS
jgi:hypothetical protein